MRREGKSIKDIRDALGIPLSTLSGWLRSISLTSRQKKALDKRWRQALITARIGAKKWHNAQKAERIAEANTLGQRTLDALTFDKPVLELALAMLYLGEGAKKSNATALGSSDPRIARFFVHALNILYGISPSIVKCHLHLRSDQNEKSLIQFWSKETGIPRGNFGKTLFDKRTLKSPTYPNYKGVCSMYCGRVDIQRRLVYIANGFCDNVKAEK